MSIEEKSLKDLKEEYTQAQRERKAPIGDLSRWGKCPRCQGTGKATCPSCKGLGRNMASMNRNQACPPCQGSGKTNCPQPGCQGGWVKINPS